MNISKMMFRDGADYAATVLHRSHNNTLNKGAVAEDMGEESPSSLPRKQK